MLFDASQHGIERLEICDSEADTKNPTIVTLENCVKITSESGEITVWTKSGQLVLNADEDQAKNWELALKKVAFKEKGHKRSNCLSVIEADNDLYYSSYDEGVFEVMALPFSSDVAERCRTEPKKYILELTQVDIQLKDVKDKEVIYATWPYRYIRKYGYRESNFTFEAGRKCMTGEGMFCFQHAKPKEIFKCMSSRMKIMKALIANDNSVSIDCGESQLSAAMSMEAGSRSPLPPSPNQKTPEFETAITQSHLSMTRVALSSEDKPAPPKPRKTLTLPIEPIAVPRKANDYACIKNITDAWKTLGIDEPRHTEKTPEKDLIEFSFHRSNSRNHSKTKITRTENNNVDEFTNKIVITDDDGNYERLDFLRSNSKVSNGYEKVCNLGGKKQATTPTSITTMDDYEEMVSPTSEPDTTTFRLADDSYLGYGKLRKISTPTSGLPPPPIPSSLIDSANCFLDHSKYNGLNYAIVSKPKQV